MQNQKEHVKFLLHRARTLTDKMLEAFESDEDWMFQAHPQANHALWIVGHLALADNAFAATFRPDTASKPEGWDTLFWFGSELKDDRAAYPPTAEVLAYFRDRRENLLSVIDDLTDEELEAAAPGPEERSPIAGAPNIGDLLFFGAFHEGMHLGQLSIARKGLGNSPLM